MEECVTKVSSLWPSGKLVHIAPNTTSKWKVQGLSNCCLVQVAISFGTCNVSVVYRFTNAGTALRTSPVATSTLNASATHLYFEYVYLGTRACMYVCMYSNMYLVHVYVTITTFTNACIINVFVRTCESRGSSTCIWGFAARAMRGSPH